MPSRSINDLNERLKPLCNQFLVQCMAEGINAFLTCTYRSNEEQEAEYAKGRTAPGHIVTNARSGQSPHNCVDSDGRPSARGFDFAIKTKEGSLDWDASDGQWQRAMDILRSLGLVSGGDFKIKDYAHAELANWHST